MSEIPEDMHLIVSIMGQMTSDAHDTWSKVADSLLTGGRRDQARVALIRDLINELLSGPYMPTPNTLVHALYPSDAMLDSWLVEHYGDDWCALESTFRPCWKCSACSY